MGGLGDNGGGWGAGACSRARKSIGDSTRAGADCTAGLEDRAESWAEGWAESWDDRGAESWTEG
jgi:hypothetical protein